MKISPVVIPLLAALGLQPLAWSDESERTRDIQRELDAARVRMLEIWPGQYENSDQIAIDQRRGYTSWRDGGHAHVHSTVALVDVPGIGDDLLYVEDYLDGDASKIFRQKLYELTTDVERQAVVLTLHSFKDPESVVGAYEEPALLRELTRADIRNRRGCEIYFRPLGNGFSGAFDYGACTTDKGMVADNRIFIEPGHYWFSDQFRPAEAPRPHVSIGQNWHRLSRAGE